VKRALEIIWKFKYLWVFGFFVEAISGGGGGGFGSWPDDWNKLNVHVPHFFTHISLAIILLLVLAALLLFLIFLILGIISQGGLIHCVSRIQSGEKPTFGNGWNAGIKNFWRILGIWIVILILIFGAAVLTLGPFILLLIGFKVLGLLFGMILVPLFVALLVVILLIDLYANRTCIIEGKGVFDSIAGGWDTLRSNLGKTFIVTLISIGSTIVYIIGFILVGLVLAIPFILIGIANLFWGIASGVLVGLIYIILVSGAWGAYIDSFWTLAFLELKKLKPAKATE